MKERELYPRIELLWFSFSVFFVPRADEPWRAPLSSIYVNVSVFTFGGASKRRLSVLHLVPRPGGCLGCGGKLAPAIPAGGSISPARTHGFRVAKPDLSWKVWGKTFVL